jgi:hypothetical protein
VSAIQRIHPYALQNFDGRPEILLGTFGCRILTYQIDSGAFTLHKVSSYPLPIRSVYFADMTGDGLREVVVLTSEDLHVVQVRAQ